MIDDTLYRPIGATTSPNTDDYGDLVIDTGAPSADQIDEIVSYAEFVDNLIEVIQIKESCQWLAGDRLQGVESRYRECTIETIADEVGVSPTVLYEWKNLAAFYVSTIRDHYRGLGLSYSHLRIAYREFPELDDAYAFLDMCVEQKWSVRAAAIEAKKSKGREVNSPIFTGPLSFRVVNGAVIVEGLAGVELVAGKIYQATLKDVR